MATIDELKSRVDLNDLAEFMGLERPDNKGNYRSPHHDDKAPSLSIFKNGKTFKDHSAGDAPESKGDCINFVQWVNGCDTTEAIKFLHEYTGLPLTRPEGGESMRDKSLAEIIQFKSFHKENEADLEKAVAYLKGRGIPEAVTRRGIVQRTIGFNVYHSDRVAAGQPMHGGPAVAFFTKCRVTGRVVSADMRYLDPDLNGGVKTQCQGEKDGFAWAMDWRTVKSAHTVYVVESPINAVSVEACGMKGVAAVATRGTGTIESIDWGFLTGKKVMICMDNDEPNERGVSPGRSAGWRLHELLLGLNVAAFLVDQYEWEVNDVNDFIKDVEPARLETELQVLRTRLQKIDPFLIPGLPGNNDFLRGKPRMYLPPHDYARYWQYRPKEDFTTVASRKSDADGNEQEVFSDVCGFRVAGISRVTIASATSTMSGQKDAQPSEVFAVTAQTVRHGYELQRRVVEDEKLHALSTWEKFGPIYSKVGFARMINILERTADIGSRKAANFVGLCWQDGKAIVNEGPDCYFTEPEKQCPYHNLTFPSSHPRDAKPVIEAFDATFADSAALMLLVWGLGGHLKAFLGYWPHVVMQASKGSGKSTLIKKLESTLGFTMFSGQSLQTEFRLLTSIGHTSHPVGWEEISARRMDVIDKALSLLQESYQYTVTRRGSDMTEYLNCAPVLLAGEDVPVDTLLGKVVRTDLSGRKGPMMPEGLPRFPVRQWLDWLAKHSKADIFALKDLAMEYCHKHSRAEAEDEGAKRIMHNYAVMLVAWRLLCEFAGVSREFGSFSKDCIAEMNLHIKQTKAAREPWVWILELVIGEWQRGQYHFPFLVERHDVTGEPFVLFRATNAMHHLKHTPALKDSFNALTIKSAGVFKQALVSAGVVESDRADRVVRDKRECHLLVLRVKKLEEYGIELSYEESVDEARERADLVA